MVVIGAVPQPEVDPDSVGDFLTFVVPASSGCNLKCSFCLVRQRQEISEARLLPEDFARFIHQAAERRDIFAIAIQGYEPLLPESMPYTQAVLASGRFRKLPTTLVTNGVHLCCAIDQLKMLSPHKIAISLDAAAAEHHDRIRGVPGTWVAAIGGIERALTVLAPQTHIVVSSVLQPSKRHYLDAMPARLREIGIDRWIITPLLRVGADHTSGPVGDQTQLFRELMILQEHADRAGVRLTVDDEFGHLRHAEAVAFQPSLRALQVRTLPRNVELFRLAPGGECSKGSDVLRQVTSETPRWQADAVHAGDFLETVGC
jgi:MoaA/NifB/PqqE/SkfB family radical SAM enzyme